MKLKFISNFQIIKHKNFKIISIQTQNWQTSLICTSEKEIAPNEKRNFYYPNWKRQLSLISIFYGKFSKIQLLEAQSFRVVIGFNTCVDFKSLFTNIPVDYAIELMKEIILEYKYT